MHVKAHTPSDFDGRSMPDFRKLESNSSSETSWQYRNFLFFVLFGNAEQHRKFITVVANRDDRYNCKAAARRS